MVTLSHPPIPGVAIPSDRLPTVFISAGPSFWRFLVIRGSELIADVSGPLSRVLPSALAERFALLKAEEWMVNHDAVDARVVAVRPGEEHAP